MSNGNINLDHIRVSGTAEVLGGHAGNPSLHARDEDGRPLYSLLVLAPFQWGPGVREHSKGVAVEAIARAFAMHPDAEAVAGSLGIEAEAVIQAVRYASAVGFLAIDQSHEPQHPGQ